MDFLVNLFTGNGLATTLLYICITAFAGVLLGKAKLGKISLGIAGVLFVGLILAHFGAKGDPTMLHFAQEFGLILFVYSIGIEVGPRFFSTFRSDGLLLNFFAIGIVALDFVIALAIHYITGESGAVVTGIMCGAVTNTPGLGAAKQVVSDYNAMNPLTPIDGDVLGTAYAVAYPLGVIGIILAMILLKAIFRIKTENEVEAYKKQLGEGEHLESVVITVSNKNLFGESVEYVQGFVDKELAFSRIERNGEFIVPTADLTIEEGDIIHGVSTAENLDDLRMKLGKVEIGQKKDVEGNLIMQRFMVTNRKLAGKTIEQIGIYRRYPANITRIYRSGIEILPTKSTVIEVGDNVRVVGQKEVMPQIQSEIGDSIKEWSHPQIIPMFLGIALGLIVGSIPFYLPGLPAPAKLGLAGGPLLVAILLGHKGRIGSMSFYMNPGANMMLREVGIVLFLACVGLQSGGQFVQTIVDGGYMWVLYGFIITFIPLMTIGTIARLMKVNYLKICGFLSGSMTDPPALEYANSLSSVSAQSTAYATVYPLTMFLRILLGQTLVLITI